jgi:hypothetical protein
VGGGEARGTTRSATDVDPAHFRADTARRQTLNTRQKTPTGPPHSIEEGRRRCESQKVRTCKPTVNKKFDSSGARLIRARSDGLWGVHGSTYPHGIHNEPVTAYAPRWAERV